MKPRTNLQKIVSTLNDSLTPISPKAMEWAINRLITHVAFRTSSNATTCGDCGHKFHFEGKYDSVIRCPKCGKKVKVIDTNKRVMEENTYFGVLDVVDSIQVERVVRLKVMFRKGQPLSYHAYEVCRLWLNAKGQTALTSKSRMMSYYVDAFIEYSPTSLKGMTDVHLIIADCEIYPHYRLIPELRRNGFRKLNCHPFKLMSKLLTDPRIETLIKAGRNREVEYFITKPYRLDSCWDSLKIALRHGYVISDVSIWADTISLLSKIGKDIRSPKYICPENLQAAHDHWLDKVAMKERRKQVEEQLKRAKKHEEEFLNEKGCFFGIVIDDEDIHISVLDSLEAFREEGETMHHCVFSAAYYNMKDSVILSARDGMGKRVETIEFSLSKQSVVQSRGYCNKNTELHDRIVKLVNDNAHLFLKARASA